MTTVTKTVFGLDTPDEICDRLEYEHIDQRWLAEETDLYATKWFDNRLLNPVRATYLYAHHWAEIYPQVYRAELDRDRGKHVRGLKHRDLFKCPPQQITGVWRGRQAADGLGIPYDLFIKFAMEGRLRAWKQSFLPRPHQLYSECVLVYVLEKWDDYQDGFFMYGKHPAYKAENYCGLPHQDAHRAWVIRQAKRRDNQLRILQEVLAHGLITIDCIAAGFSPTVAERVLSIP